MARITPLVSDVICHKWNAYFVSSCPGAAALRRYRIGALTGAAARPARVLTALFESSIVPRFGEARRSLSHHAIEMGLVMYASYSPPGIEMRRDTRERHFIAPPRAPRSILAQVNQATQAASAGVAERVEGAMRGWPAPARRLPAWRTRAQCLQTIVFHRLAKTAPGAMARRV